MRVRAYNRAWRWPALACVATAALFAAAPALAGPGLPRTYTVTRIEPPHPVAGGSFGWGIASADLTGDGKDDLLVAQAQTIDPNDAAANQVDIFDGVTGKLVDTILP